MNWKHCYNVESAAMETFHKGGVHVPGNELTERSILHKDFIAEDEAFWNWIPLYKDTFECDVGRSESGEPGNEN